MNLFPPRPRKSLRFAAYATVLVATIAASTIWLRNQSDAHPLRQEAVFTERAASKEGRPPAKRGSDAVGHGEFVSIRPSFAHALSPQEILDAARSASEAWPSLKSMALAGDTAAMHAVMSLAARCGGVTDPETLARMKTFRTAPAESGAEKARQATLMRVVEYCDEPDLIQPDFLQRVAVGLRESASAGDAYGLIEELSSVDPAIDPDEASAALTDLFAQTNDSALAIAAAAALDKVPYSIDQPLWAPLAEYRTLEPARIDAIRQAASQLVACRLGADCGSNSWFLIGECIHLGACPVSPSVPEYFRQNRVSAPNEQAIVEELVRHILELRNKPPRGG